MLDTTTTAPIAGYVAGTWNIDPVHSVAAFTVRHLVTKVRGHFRDLAGTIDVAEDPLESSVTVTIDAGSIDTSNEQRDNHLRSADFLEVETYPTMSFASTAIRPEGDHYLIDGELTLKDVTRSITARLDVGGFTPGPDGIPRSGYTAAFQINRHDYNVDFSWILETGGAMVGDTVDIELEVEAVLDQ